MSSVAGDVSNVRNTFSSWDSCMAEDYCKYPVIIGIIIGSLILISIIWCCARCLCCGAECCCGCLSCCNRCCPSPRGSKNEGYQKPQMYPPHNQYQSPQPPVYLGQGGGYQPAQTATFDAPSRGKYNEDALPAMPSWGNATSRRVEQEPSDLDIEMEKLNGQQHPSPQEQNLLQPHQRQENAGYEDQHYGGDVGTMPAGGPYTDWSSHPNDNTGYNPRSLTAYNPQQSTSYNPPHSTTYNPPQSTNYTPQLYHPQPTAPIPAGSNPYYDFSHQQQQQPLRQTTSPYYNPASPTSPVPTSASSIYPPTYHTREPSGQYARDSYGAAPPTYRTAPSTIASSPPPMQQEGQGHVRMPSSGTYGARKPVSGSWRDV